MTLLMDTAEPEAIERLVSQSLQTVRINLNQTSRADYYFGGEDGKTRQFCRVQTHELLSDMDSQEDELRRYYNSADESNLVVEGLVSSIALSNKRARTLEDVSVRRHGRPTALYSYKVTDSGYIYDEQVWETSASKYFAWVASLDNAGIRTYYTVNWTETAKLLVAIYKWSQKPTHSTLNRYYRPRIAIKEQNPMVKALMGLSYAYGLDIGEVKATALASEYSNLMSLAVANVSDICQLAGIGKVIANRLLLALGREG